MRRFVIVSHTVPPDGDWGLDDLAGDAGRVDVVCRAVTMALFTSHGIRKDTEVIALFARGPVAVRIRGGAVQRMNPDERSTAARLRKALQAQHPDPWWKDVEEGIDVAPMDLAEVLEELGPVAWLDRDGEDTTTLPDAAWVLSDHQSFTDEESATIQQHATHRVSLGDTWYHGHHAIGIVQYLLDRAG